MAGDLRKKVIHRIIDAMLDPDTGAYTRPGEASIEHVQGQFEKLIFPRVESEFRRHNKRPIDFKNGEDLKTITKMVVEHMKNSDTRDQVRDCFRANDLDEEDDISIPEVKTRAITRSTVPTYWKNQDTSGQTWAIAQALVEVMNGVKELKEISQAQTAELKELKVQAKRIADAPQQQIVVREQTGGNVLQHMMLMNALFGGSEKGKGKDSCNNYGMMGLLGMGLF